MMSRSGRFALLLTLGACRAPDGDSVPAFPSADDTGEPFPECAAMEMALVQEWPEESLPTGDLDHSEPGYAIGDFDEDGWLDAFVAWGGGSQVLWNDGAGNLTVAPAMIDGDAAPDGSSAAAADLDADGHLDVVLGREWGGIDRVLWGDGTGAFTSTELVGSDGSSQTSTVADFDGDGDLDIYVAQMVSDSEPDLVLSGEMVGEPNLLFRQTGLRSFELDESAIPQATNYGMTFQGTPFDADADGDLDIYEANAWGNILVPNQLLVNDGTGTFTVAADCSCDLQMNAMGAAVGDANADGLPDVYVTDIGSPNLIISLGDGSFADATVALNAQVPASAINLSSWGTVFADMNRDACADILVSFGGLGHQGDELLDAVEPDDEDWVDPETQPDVLLLGDCRGHFERGVVGLDDYPGTKNRVVALGDFDQDGRDDLLAAGKSYLRYWHTAGGCDTGLTVSLEGPAENASAIGATVTVDVGDRSLKQWLSPSSTHSSSAPELTFGLGGRAMADRVEVVWPDGEVTEERDVPAGRVRLSR